MRNTSPPFNAAQHNHGYIKHEYVSQEGQVFSCLLNWLLPHPSQPVIQREERPREREWWQPFRRSHFRRQQKILFLSMLRLLRLRRGGKQSRWFAP
jgi:hypothetical protein